NLLYRNPGITFFQDVDDLFVSEPLFHIRFPLLKRTLLDSEWTGNRGAGHTHYTEPILKEP
ncbi:hypothetical protein, partial [Motiliproteus sediminis]|uniref:hypothetical protein n=1 Tax=Motiliproteus sediminis TaxID=1468178 RepID=UPI001AEFBC09